MKAQLTDENAELHNALQVAYEDLRAYKSAVQEAKEDALKIGRNWQNDRNELFEALKQKDVLIEEMQKNLQDVKYQCEQADPHPALLGILVSVNQTLQSLKEDKPNV